MCDSHALPPPERHWRLAAGLILPAGVLVAPAFLQLGDVPLCAFKHLTGVPCPLCGGIRACAALAQGDVAAAWLLNPGLLPVLAVATLHSGLLLIEAARGRKLGPHPSLVLAWQVTGAGLLVSWLARVAGFG